MGDSENSLPDSYKRAAGREISKDNPGLDDKERTCEEEQPMEHFKKASKEVMATRRIVTVRRTQKPSAAPAPSNPFAGIKLVQPKNSSARDNVTAPEQTLKTGQENVEEKTNLHEDIKKRKMESEKQEKSKTSECDSVVGMKGDVIEDSSKPETDETEQKKIDLNKKVDNAEVEPEKKEESKISECDSAVEIEGDVIKESAKPETDKSEEKKTENGDFSLKKSDEIGEFSFPQVSSTQYAFTGFPRTWFFGSVPKDESSPGPNSGLKTDQAVHKIVKQEIPIETLEENEKSVFINEATLFEFLDNKWKEKGKGEIRLNIRKSGTRKGRLVMRSKENHRFILNARLYPDVNLADKESRVVTFTCFNTATDGKDSLSTFALRFKSSITVDEFWTAVSDHRDDSLPSEKSPKASDK